jgi:hypothetical protein
MLQVYQPPFAWSRWWRIVVVTAVSAAIAYAAGLALHVVLSTPAFVHVLDTVESLFIFVAIASLALAGLLFARQIEQTDYSYAHWFIAAGLLLAVLFGSSALFVLFFWKCPVNLIVLPTALLALALASAEVAAGIDRRENFYPRLLRSPRCLEAEISAWLQQPAARVLSAFSVAATAVAFTLTGLTAASVSGGHLWLFAVAHLGSALIAPLFYVWTLFAVAGARYHQLALRAAMAEQRIAARPKPLPMSEADLSQEAKERARGVKMTPPFPEEAAQTRHA